MLVSLKRQATREGREAACEESRREAHGQGPFTPLSSHLQQAECEDYEVDDEEQVDERVVGVKA